MKEMKIDEIFALVDDSETPPKIVAFRLSVDHGKQSFIIPFK